MKEDSSFSWLANEAQPAEELTFGRGDAPTLVYKDWQRWARQPVEVGAVASDAWYRRCALPDCQVWAGPYLVERDALREGLWHARCAHRIDTPGFGGLSDD